MLHGLSYEFKVIASIAAVPVLQPLAEHLVVDLSQGQIDKIVFGNQSELSTGTIEALNEIIKAALKTDLLDKFEDFDLTPYLKPWSCPILFEGIDAVSFSLSNNDKAYFFKGQNYIRYDVASRQGG